MRFWLPLLALTPLLVSLQRPVAFDDPFYLAVAAQILRDPWHPFDATIGLSTVTTTLWEISTNPPGLGYWLAGVQALGGGTEFWLHLSLLPFAIATVLAGGRLARRFVGGSGWVTAAWVASPAFIVSASTLMADVPALAFTLWGVTLWVEGVDADRAGSRRAGALLAGLALLVKYTAVLTLPVLALYVLLAAPAARRTRALLDLWPALPPSAAWAALAVATHGRIHVMGSLWIVDASWRLSLLGWFLEHGIALLTFLAAAGIFPALSLIPALRTGAGRWLILVAVALGLGAGLSSRSVWVGASPSTRVAVGVLVTLGAAALLTMGRDAVRGTRDDLFLAAWVAVHVAFIWFWLWTVAVRFVLLLMPPLALLLARALGPRRDRLLAVATAAAISVTSVVLQADAFPDAFHREVIAALARETGGGGRKIYFVGDGGFHYYAERAGMERLDWLDRRPRVGDLILQPYYVANSIMPPAFKPRIEKAAHLAAPAPPLSVHTMQPRVGAGFWTSSWGPLPFTIAREPAAGAWVWMISR